MPETSTPDVENVAAKSKREINIQLCAVQEVAVSLQLIFF